MRVWARVALVLIVFGLPAALMLGPFPNPKTIIGIQDGPAHALAFGAMTAAILWAAPRLSRAHGALIVFSVGAALEIGQTFTGRSASLIDLAANLIGIALVAFFWPARRRPHRDLRQS